MVVLLIISNWLLKRLHPRPTPRIRLIRGMSFGCLSGILSAHSLLLAKSAVELLVRTIIDRHNEFNRWESWIILLGLIAFALSQLYYMHRGLKLCSTSVLYPLVFCVYNIIAIIDGLIYFHQSSRLSALQAGLIALGTVILLGGVSLLSWRLNESEEEPSSPTVHKHKARVPTPQTVLTPGMGIVHGDSEEPSEFPLDLEQSAGAHDSAYGRAKRSDETTPLLSRTTTAPARSATPRSRKPTLRTDFKWTPKTSPSPRRPPRRRRMTISEETNEIWDELNDRESLLSPARRSAELEYRPRSGTLPARRQQTSWLDQIRRTSWWEGMGGSGPSSKSRGKGRTPRAEAVDDASDDGEGSDPDALPSPVSNRKRSWGLGAKGNRDDQERLGDWLKMKWWRKRWRD